MNSRRATFCDSITAYEDALRGMFAGKPEDTESYLSKIFTPTFTLHSDEPTMDFPAFVKHISFVRDVTKGNIGVIKVVQFLRDGNQLAERHITKGEMPDGRSVTAESFMFVTIAEDGRIEEIHELVNRKFGEEASE